ncbi:MAG: hypothetical protein C0483_15385 [Pirellula sp.]|nr:hypothetical protein [Pirellula sp.]
MKATLMKLGAITGAVALVVVYLLMQSGKRSFEEAAPPLPPKPADRPNADLTPPVDPRSGPVFALPAARTSPTAGTPTTAADLPPVELPVQVAPQSKPLDPRILPATSNAPINIVAPTPLGTGSAMVPGSTTAGPTAPSLTVPATGALPALGAGPTAPTLPPTTTLGVPKIQSGPLTISTQPTTNAGLALPQIGPGAHNSTQASPLIKSQTLTIPGQTAPQPMPTGPQLQLGTGGPRIGPQSPILPGTPSSGPPSPLSLPK